MMVKEVSIVGQPGKGMARHNEPLTSSRIQAPQNHDNPTHRSSRRPGSALPDIDTPVKMDDTQVTPYAPGTLCAGDDLWY